MTVYLKELFARRGLKTADSQLDKLCHVIDACDTVEAWSKDKELSAAPVIVVDEPPTPPHVHTLRRALAPDAKVIIPFSEDPAFDYLKSQLRCHGVVGASAPVSPHQIWWGGKTTAKPANCLAAIQRSHVVTCVKPNTHQDTNAVLFAKGLDIVGITYTIERDDAFAHCDDRPDIRSRLLLDAWRACDKPLIWLDPVSNTDLTSIALNIDGADFAAMPSSAGLSTSLLYFGRSPATFDLLKNWNNLCCEFPSLPASYLLDAAWALISSQRPLVTQWLPSQNAIRIDHSYQSEPVLDHYTLTNPSQKQARRAYRTGAPEPHCVMKSPFGGRGSLTLITLSQASGVHDVAQTVHSAVEAFDKDNGGFSNLGIVICQNDKEAADVIGLTTEGWVLYALPGVALDKNVFNKVSEHIETDRAVFIMPETVEPRLTSTGVALQATRAKAIFGRSYAFKAGKNQPAPTPTSSLKLVPEARPIADIGRGAQLWPLDA